jgi:hypothetical protein
MEKEGFNVGEFWQDVERFIDSLDPINHELIDVYSGPLLEPEQRGILGSERLRELGYYVPSLQFLIGMARQSRQVHIKVLEEIFKCLVVAGRFLFANRVLEIVIYVLTTEEGLDPKIARPQTKNDSVDFMVSGIEVSLGHRYEYLLANRLYDAVEEVFSNSDQDLTPLQLLAISFSGDGQYRFSRFDKDVLGDAYEIHCHGPLV